MRHNKKFIAILVSVLALVLVFSMVLCACNDKNKQEQPADENTEQNQNQPGDNGNGNGNENEEQKPGDNESGTTTEQLSVSFDENATFNLYNITDAFQVSVASADGTSRAVDFSIKSSKLSDDGLFIDVVIEAAGMEKTIRVPYEKPLIREELMPLYNAILDQGDRFLSFSLVATGKEDEDSEESACLLKAVVNVSDEGVEFALTGEADKEEAVFLTFTDKGLTVGNYLITMDELMEVYSYFASNVEYDDIESVIGSLDEINDEMLDNLPIIGEYEEDIAEIGEGVVSEYEDGFEDEDVTDLFIKLSEFLDEMESSFAPELAVFGLNYSAENGVYELSVNSKALTTKTVMDEIKGLIDDEEVYDNLVDVIDAIDEETDGAFKNGDYQFKVALTVDGCKLSFGITVENKKVGGSASITAIAEIADEAYAIPEVTIEEEEEEEIEWSDIKIRVPFSIFQKDFDTETVLVLHPAAIMGEEGTTYGTLNFYCGEDEESYLYFVLDEKFAYLDITNLYGAIVGAITGSNMEDPVPMVFYDTFTVDGEPATFVEALPSIIEAIQEKVAEMFMKGEEENDSDDDEEEFEENELFKNGYGACFRDDEDDGIFDIGSTEDDLRARIVAYYEDENEQDVEYEDYTIEGFDSSKSFNGYIKVVFAKGYYYELPIVVRDETKAHKENVMIYIDEVAIGTSLNDLKEMIFVTYLYSDSDEDYEGVSWEVPADVEITIVSVNGSAVDENFSFDEVCTNIPVVLHLNDDTTDYFTYVSVYDPGTIPDAIECDRDGVHIEDENTTEDDIKEMIVVILSFRDGHEVVLTADEYEIEGYKYGEDYVRIVYNDELSCGLYLIYDNYDPQPIDGGDEDGMDMNIAQYLRFGSFEELIAIIEDNKELFDSVFTVEGLEGENGGSLRIIINAENDKDLVAVINLFVGIPGEDGEFVDIDETFALQMISLFSLMTQKDIAGGFESFAGVELADFLSALDVEFVVSVENGFDFLVIIGDGDEDYYFYTGIFVQAVDCEGDVTLTEEQIKDAYHFEQLMTIFQVMAAMSKPE